MKPLLSLLPGLCWIDDSSVHPTIIQ